MTVDLDLAYASAGEQARLVAAREVSPRELVTNSLARIEHVQPRLNCFTHLWADDALAAADRATEAVVRGDDLGPLHGVPIALKETTQVSGKPFTLGSLTHRDVVVD
ncbi:MAG: amidase family protein, partial [Ilumatobacteraceae bacterium]